MNGFFWRGWGEGWEGENWEIGQDEAHQQNLFYHSVMRSTIVNEQFLINHQFRLQY